MRRLVAVVVFLMVASVAATVAKQEPTLTSMKDVARRLGGTATNKIEVESPSMSLSELVTQSDLIIHARLDGVTTHLSDDESRVRLVPLRCCSVAIHDNFNSDGRISIDLGTLGRISHP